MHSEIGVLLRHVNGMWMMLNHSIPDDWVLATGETHTVKEFVEKAFSIVNLDWSRYAETSDKYFRPNEVNYLLGDPSKAKQSSNEQRNII